MVGVLVLGWIQIAKAQTASPPVLKINEIYYDHKGKDEGHEWVELQNVGQDLITIDTSSESNWRIYDRQPHLIKYDQNSVSVAPGSYLIIADHPEIFLTDYTQVNTPVLKSAIQLTNTGGTIKISNDTGKTYFEEVSYSSSQGGNGNGRSLEKDDQGWYESQVIGGSPGDQNSSRTATSVNADDQAVTVNQPSTIQPISIKQVKELPEGETTSVIGSVTAPPNSLSAKTFYIQDDSGGIQVYAAQALDMTLGDRLKVVGKRSHYNAEKRITAQKDGLELLGEKSDPRPHNVGIQSINSELVGLLITVAGQININKGNLELSDENGSTLTIVIRESTGIKRPSWHDGDWVEVRGILSLYKDQLRILPRFQEDISWRAQEDADQSVTISTQPKTETSSQLSPTTDREDNTPDQPPPAEKKASAPATSRKTNGSSRENKSHNKTDPETVKEQIKGLLVVNDPPPPENIDKRPVDPSPNQPKLPKWRDFSIIYGIVIGCLMLSIWQKRFIIQKMPTRLFSWAKNWPKKFNRER